MDTTLRRSRKVYPGVLVSTIGFDLLLSAKRSMVFRGRDFWKL